MRKYSLLLILFIQFFSEMYSQTTGDYRTAATGNWNAAATWQRYDGANWVAAVTAPSSTDGVISILNSHTITANTAITADQVIVDNGGTLTISGSTFTIANGADVNDVVVIGTLNFSSGNIAGIGTLAVNTVMNWSGGTLDAPAIIVGATAGTLTITNNTGLSDVLTIQNGGFLIVNAGTMLFNSGTINNNGNIILNNSLAASFTLNSGTCNINNNVDGYISKNSGAGTFSSTVNINNAGTFVVNTSSFTQSGSTFTNSSLISISAGATFSCSSGSQFNTGATVAGDGTLSFSSGTNNINLGLALPTTITFNFINGNLQGTGSLTINGAMNWSGGTLDLPTTIANNATVTMSNNVGLGDALTIASGGIFTWNAGNMLFNGGTVNNSGSILLNNSLAASFAANTGTNAVNNNSSGVISKNSGVGIFSSTVNVNNAGTIIGVGTFSFTAGFTNTGTIAPGLSPGILTVNGTAPFGANSMLSIEIMDGSGAGTGHDQMQRAGNLTLNGNLTATETGTVPNGDYVVILLTSGTITGTFSTTDMPAGYLIIYNSNNVVIRKGALATWYRDLDNDTYGDPNNSTQAATQPAGYVSNNTDCNDNNVNIHPNATEVCNGADDDCDGQIDEGVQTTFYLDADGDGYGNPQISVQACSAPSGYVPNNLDCHDNVASIHPGATEICNSIDDDCDGEIDEGLNLTFYHDGDQDGYGNPAVSIQACSAPPGYVSNNLDCQDGIAAIHPGATEVCNGADDDCDGQIDEGVQTTFYRDLDGDGFGNPAVTQQACSAPTGYVTNNTDCNDNNAAIYPGAAEVCNGADDDCDGQIDEGAQPVNWYQDLDGDGFGNPSVTQVLCTQPSGYVLNNTDCNDNNANINPNATEVCNGIDDDCDGQIDEGVQTTFYRDLDGDGFGNNSVTQQACSVPNGYVANNTDCNDNNSNIHPNATEVCNGIDDDCDGQIDEGVTTTFYQDNDSDGFGNPAVTQQACSVPNGYVANNSDCNDNNAAINPNTVWYLDSDNDNYYTGSGITQCSSPGAGYKFSGLTAGNDCNDNNPNIHPGAIEICNNLDDDCDGQVDEGAQPVLWYQDSDNDGFGNAAVSQLSCSQPNGYVLNNTDCNDNNVNIHPNATEVCNGADDDCDGQIDEGVQTTFYRDLDGDGFGNNFVTQQACSAPNGYVANNTDCNDNNFNIYPNAIEVCNGADDDCDGQIDEEVQTTFYRDLDGDGFGNNSVTQQACSAPTGYVANNTDCNDNNSNIHPNATEVCNGADDDCDGQTDEGCGGPDNDGDGFTVAQGDCNDNDNTIYPAAVELCDGKDNDCDGLIDENSQATEYRSKQSGNWNDASSWEVNICGNWQTASTTPPANAIVTIRHGHTITASTNVGTAQITIDNGGHLIVAANTFAITELLTIKAGGRFSFQDNTIISLQNNARIDNFGLVIGSAVAGKTITIVGTGNLNNALNNKPGSVSEFTGGGKLSLSQSNVNNEGDMKVAMPETEINGQSSKLKTLAGGIIRYPQGGNVRGNGKFELRGNAAGVRTTQSQVLNQFSTASGSTGGPLKIHTNYFFENGRFIEEPSNAGIEVELFGDGFLFETNVFEIKIITHSGINEFHGNTEISRDWLNKGRNTFFNNASFKLNNNNVRLLNDASGIVESNGTNQFTKAENLIGTRYESFGTWHFNGIANFEAPLVLGDGSFTGSGRINIYKDFNWTGGHVFNQVTVFEPGSQFMFTAFAGELNGLIDTKHDVNTFISGDDPAMIFGPNGQWRNNGLIAGAQLSLKRRSDNNSNLQRFIHSGEANITTINSDILMTIPGKINFKKLNLNGTFGIANLTQFGEFNFEQDGSVTGSGFFVATDANINFLDQLIVGTRVNISRSIFKGGQTSDAVTFENTVTINSSSFECLLKTGPTSTTNFTGSGITNLYRGALFDGNVFMLGSSNLGIGDKTTVNNKFIVKEGVHKVIGLGTRGFEDMGAGLSAIFQIESQVTIDVPLDSKGLTTGIGPLIYSISDYNKGFSTLSPGLFTGIFTLGLNNPSDVFILPSNTNLNIEIQDPNLPAGEGYDRLQVNNDVNLNGSTINVFDIPDIAVGSSFIVVTSDAQVTGKFGTINLPPGYRIIYTTNSVIVEKAENCNGVTANIIILGNKNKCPVTLQANPGGPNANYQWFKNDVLVNGATERRYTAITSGSYTVQVTTNNGCVDMSDPVVITSCSTGELRVYTNTGITTDLQPIITQDRLKIYPNPASDHITIDLSSIDDYNGEATVQLFTLRGDILVTQKLNVFKGRIYSNLKLDSKWKDDLYLVKVIMNKKIYTGKIIKIDP